MRSLIIVLIHLSAGMLPLVSRQLADSLHERTFRQWPSEFQGAELRQLPLTAKERGFSRNFPGNIGRFTDGSREIIIRYLQHPSRKLHPAADCLRGSGYSVQPQPISRDQNGRFWGCVLAQRDAMRYRVCERIHDQSGNSWYDVSSWYWSVVLQNRQGPWWAVTVAVVE